MRPAVWMSEPKTNSSCGLASQLNTESNLTDFNHPRVSSSFHRSGICSYVQVQRRAPTSGRSFSHRRGATGSYIYGGPNQPPHAVRSISGTVNGVTNPGFKYDADGNLTCEYTGNNCGGGAVTKETDGWWSFNMLHTVSDGANTLSLTYDSEHARITQVLSTASTTTTTTYLNDPISGTLAEKVVSGSSTTWNDYLTVDGKLTAEQSAVVGGLTTRMWFVLDHLGSVAVITDASGNVLATNGRQSFDAWGKQRHEDGTDDTTCSQPLTSPTTRGYTGHEEIGALCPIDMNARLYDPSLARFMSADTTVPDPYDGQSYNRYTYVDNRPLTLTDPTGHLPGEPEDCGDGCVVVLVRPGVAGGIVVNPGDSKYPPHGTMSDLDNYKGGPTSFQQFWVSALTVGLGAKNVSVTVNPNGSLALNFTCGGGDGGCVSGGRAINAMFGGTENYVGGEETGAGANTQGEIPDSTNLRAMVNGLDMAKINQTIDEAIKTFGIDLTGVGGIRYAPNLADEAQTGKDGITNLGPKAFRDFALLGSTLSHEFDIHIRLQLLKGMWWTDPQGRAMQEVQAYDYQLSPQQIARFNLSDDDIRLLKGYKSFWYNQLNSINQTRANAGYFDTYTK